jgi:general secretion pathway protein H
MGRGTALGARGFTFLELLVVLLLLALTASLAGPAIGRSTDAIRTRAEIAGFAAVLRHAREQAITSRRTHAVVVDPAAHLMEVTAGDEVRRRRVLPARWAIEGASPTSLTVRFDPQGSSTGGEYRIATGDVVYRVTVDALTGRVRSARQ